MKKVIVLTNEFYPFKGGIGRYCEEVINVAKKDFDITLVAPAYDNSLRVSHLSDGICLKLFSGSQFKYWDLPKLISAVSAIDFGKYDYVLVADWPFWIALQFVNRFIPWKKKISFSLMLHGSEILNLKNGKAAIFPKLINLFDGVEGIYTNSNYTKDILYKYHKVPSQIPCKVTYLGVSQSPPPDNRTYIDKILDEEFKILSVGRLDDRKGYDLVIKAIGCLPENVRSNIVYDIVGNGTEQFKDSLLDLASEHHVTINILSGIDDEHLQKIYKESLLFVLAAKDNKRKIEGFGLVFLEAAKYGIPSIATDVGAIKEVVKNGVTGFVVAEDCEKIAAAIDYCYKDRNILRKLSDNCIADVKNYKWSDLVEKTFASLYGSNEHE